MGANIILCTYHTSSVPITRQVLDDDCDSQGYAGDLVELRGSADLTVNSVTPHGSGYVADRALTDSHGR